MNATTSIMDCALHTSRGQQHPGEGSGISQGRPVQVYWPTIGLQGSTRFPFQFGQHCGEKDWERGT